MGKGSLEVEVALWMQAELWLARCARSLQDHHLPGQQLLDHRHLDPDESHESQRAAGQPEPNRSSYQTSTVRLENPAKLKGNKSVSQKDIMNANSSQQLAT